MKIKCKRCESKLVYARCCPNCGAVANIPKRVRRLTDEEEQLVKDLRTVPAHLHADVFRLMQALKNRVLLPSIH